MHPSARKEGLLVQEVDGEVLVYDIESNRAICLNETTALVWQNCDGKKDSLEIAKAIEKKLASPVTEEIIWFAINQLNKEKLLKPAADYSDKFDGMSRREVIRKIGIGSMVALPVITALVAPQSVLAQSCLPLTNCSSNSPMTRGPGCGCIVGQGPLCCDGSCTGPIGSMMC